MPRLLALLLLLPLLAGCAGPGGGPLAVTVHVAQERPGGPPLGGASVALQWVGGELVAATDSFGDVTFHLDPLKSFTIVAFRNGWIGGPDVVSSSNVQIGDVRHEVVAFLREIPLSWIDTWPGPVDADQSTATGVAWRPHALEFSNDPSIHAAYLARLQALNMTAAWQNSATQYGDFGIGVGRNPGAAPEVVSNKADESPAPGAYTETFLLAGAPLSAMTSDPGAKLATGPTTGAPVVASQGVKITMNVVAHFAAPTDAPAPTAPGGVPGPGLLVAFIALVAAMALRRR